MRACHIRVRAQEIGISEIFVPHARARLHRGITPRRIYDVPLSLAVVVGVYENLVPSVTAVRSVRKRFTRYAQRSYAFHAAKKRKRLGLTVAHRSVVVKHTFEIERVVTAGITAVCKVCHGVVVLYAVNYPIVNRGNFLDFRHVVGYVFDKNVSCLAIQFLQLLHAVTHKNRLISERYRAIKVV